jgi:hypothetical protein
MNADEIVDTDILHGIRQRMKIHSVLPEIKRQLEDYMAQRFALRGEFILL